MVGSTMKAMFFLEICVVVGKIRIRISFTGQVLNVDTHKESVFVNTISFQELKQRRQPIISRQAVEADQILALLFHFSSSIHRPVG